MYIDQIRKRSVDGCRTKSLVQKTAHITQHNDGSVSLHAKDRTGKSVIVWLTPDEVKTIRG